MKPNYHWIAEYQSTRRGSWYGYFKWFASRAEAKEWIDQHLPKNPQLRYRIRRRES